MSGRMLIQDGPALPTHYSRRLLCSSPYFDAAPGGAPIIMLKDYIQQQKPPFEPFEALYPHPKGRGFTAPLG